MKYDDLVAESEGTRIMDCERYPCATLDLISRLTAENARLREVLQEIASAPKHRPSSGHAFNCVWCDRSANLARASLETTYDR